MSGPLVVGIESYQMLDEPTFANLYSVLVVLSDVFTLFFIFTIITKSTADMKLYKYVMLKLAICELLFNLSVSVLVSPDLLCPLSAAAIRSPIGSLSETHAFIMMAITIGISISVFFSLIDCCLIRVSIFFQWSNFLQKAFSWKGFLAVFCMNGVVISLIVWTLWLASNSNEEFLNLVTVENMTHALGSYAHEPDTVYFYVDIERPLVIPLVTSVFCLLVAVHTVSIYASSQVWKGIAKRKNNMSFKSYQNHRQLTLLVFSQNILPVFALSIPMCIVSFSFIMRYNSDAFAECIKHIVTFTVSIYPALSVVISFFFVAPYKKFLISLICSCSLRRTASTSKVSDIRLTSRPRMESVGIEAFDNVGNI